MAPIQPGSLATAPILDRLFKGVALEPGLRALLDQFFSKALPADLEALSSADVITVLEHVKMAMQQRSPEQAIVYIKPIDRGRTASGRRMAIVIVNDDMPFLVDSVTGPLSLLGLAIHQLFHPVLDVQRDTAGMLLDIHATAGAKVAEGHIRESVTYLEVDRLLEPECKALLERLHAILADVRHCVMDWPSMVTEVREAARACSGSYEERAFLSWVADNNMTLLGHRFSTESQTRPEPGLGLLRDPDYPVWEGSKQVPMPTQPLTITKANKISPVHRSAPLDFINVRTEQGKHEIVGLFTSAAYALSPRDVPLVREKVQSIIDSCGFDGRGHAGKALIHVLETFPRDELMQATVEQLLHMALGVLSLLERPRARLFVRRDAVGDFISVLVYIPRDAYRSDMRQRVNNMLLGALGGSISRYTVTLSDEGLARVHYIITNPKDQLPELASLQNALDRLVRGWSDDLENALIARVGADRATSLTMSHGNAFSAAYREQFDAAAAAIDVERLAALTDTQARDVLFYRNPSDASHLVRLKIYRQGEIIPLSDCVPVLEHLGLRAIEEFPYDLHDGALGWVHDFLCRDADNRPIDLEALRPKLEPALIALLDGRLEDDSFNALILKAGFTASDVVILRALFRYMRQAGLPFSLDTVTLALVNSPHIAQLLIAMFNARFDPNHYDNARVTELNKDIDEALAQVSALDDDRILRHYRAVIMAIQRTNVFAASAQNALAFKIKSADVPGLPLPLPFMEIFVYSPRVEGIHLRGGKVARGGIRWSDRRDDFRTEILSLMKAQTVKNAVIVPVGAKGGFYPKHLPPVSDREAWLAEGTESYRIFIRSLLSLTDNLHGSQLIAPADVVRHDGDDPYLVVAADKGTATFSDIANGLAAEAGFWLGDAFASGGSVGYDHKKMAITARGAWISVERHFREMNMSVNDDPVTVVGVGDMSGDVFGNGMLLSKSMRVIAAFDHRHIFIDPSPDTAQAFAERSRLFTLPRSSWDDYNKALISNGGGVFPRSAKNIPLSPEARAALDISADNLTPADLIRAILQAPVDLLWLGGIGTYVKAANESHADAGDKANDSTRIDADQLRAKVIGEGANLGVTQRGRIAFALRGGRINTDFIDNSAGVDCSDNEVNIKILLAGATSSGRLRADEREPLLAAMTDDVATIVLRDNYLQTQALSIAEAQAPQHLGAHIRLMRTLEKSGGLNRQVEALPDDVTLAERQRRGLGLTRPELAVMLAYSKMTLFQALVHAPVIDDPLLHEDLVHAFPSALRTPFAQDMAEHRLRREIIATKLANAIVNRGGLTLAFDLAEETGRGLGEVATSFVVAREVLALRPLWRLIDSYDYKIPAQVQTRAQTEAAAMLRIHMSDLLRYSTDTTVASAQCARLKPQVEILSAGVFDLLRPEPRRQVARAGDALKKAGTPEDVTTALLRLKALESGIGVVALAADIHTDAIALAQAYTALGERLGLDWAHGEATALEPSDSWERLLLAGTAHDCERLRLDLLRRVVQKDPGTDTDTWLTANAEKVTRIKALQEEVQASGPATTAKLTHLVNQVRLLLAG